MVMLTVQVRHPSGEKPELTGNILLRALNENLSFSENPDPVLLLPRSEFEPANSLE
jgi:hypothetical protein